MRIDLSGWTRDATRGTHRDFLALFETADRLGFGGVWFNEFRFQDPPQPYPSTLLLAAAVFARTERLRVGASVIVLPLHDPLMLAEEIAQLDFQSNGRIDVGIGRGTDPATLSLFGVGPDQSREKFETAYRTLKRTWLGIDGPTAPPLQLPHPPLYLAGYTEGSIAFAVQEELPLLLSLEPNETRQLDIYHRLRAQTGRANTLPRSSLSRYVLIAPTRSAAEARVDDFLCRRQVRRTAAALAKGLAPPTLTAADRARILADQLVWGDPAQCFDQIMRLNKKMGVGQLRCVFNGNGVLSNEEALDGMRLFADEVLPALNSAPTRTIEELQIA